jgi:hypothetical protein
MHIYHVVNKAFSGTFILDYIKSKDIPVTGREDQQGCEMSRLPHFPDNWLTDSGEVVRLTCRLLFTPRKIPGIHFC